VIVFWGDFLQNPIYGRNDFPTSDKKFGHSTGLQNGFKRWRNLMLLERYSNDRTKVLSVGNNFMSIGLGFDSGFEETHYEKLLSRFDGIFPRDPVSVKTLLALPNLTAPVELGMDCAFLIDMYAEKAYKRGSPYFVYFFGRSGIGRVKELVSEIERKTKLRGVEIKHWFQLRVVNPSEFPYLTRSMLYRHYMNLISRAAFSVTDVYHFSVNCINANTRTICIGRRRKQESTTSDFKKKVLFESLHLEGDYVELADGQGDSEEVIACEVMDRLGDDSDISEVYAALCQTKLRYRKQLTDAIRG
jgi:hypothetical protein